MRRHNLAEASQEQIEFVVFDHIEKKTFLSSLLIPAAKLSSFILTQLDKSIHLRVGLAPSSFPYWSLELAVLMVVKVEEVTTWTC